MRRVVLAAMLGGPACDVEDVGVPEGKLAVVGDVEFGPEDLAAVQSQLGAYAQLRFSGEGRSALLSALIAAQLLALEATDHGLGDDPRVLWSVTEEIAEVYLRAEVERRVPRAEVVADEAALQAYYDAHRDEFAIGERRSMRAVVFTTYVDAEVAHDLLSRGIVRLEWLGEVVTTEPQTRDDAEHPGFHPILFTEGLQAGDVLPHPVMLGELLAVGELAQRQPPTARPLSDAAVHERVVEAVAAPRREAAKAELLEELAQRHPATE